MSSTMQENDKKETFDDDAVWSTTDEPEGSQQNYPRKKNPGPKRPYNNRNWQDFGPRPLGPPPRGNWRGYNPGMWGPPPLFPPFMRPGMGFPWGRGFGPGGPPVFNNNTDNRPMRYLMRCGIPRDQLRNLPKELLQLITPEYCSVCDIALETFEMSRIHYVSKGHFKKQRKWLMHYSEVGYQQRFQKELPMKSRDLYCELCDVEITSKAHAESHYSGKPHRAIIERRKLPKNEALQQRGMEERVEQLIRREKRFLKSVPEAEKSEEQAAQAKPVQPELYCDICKTSVTCTEQMTMHLNGKRHLAKEKQHILKMMTGETTPEDTTEPADNMENEAVEPDDIKDNADDNNGNKEDGDWENGTGTWDDDRT